MFASEPGAVRRWRRRGPPRVRFGRGGDADLTALPRVRGSVEGRRGRVSPVRETGRRSLRGRMAGASVRLASTGDGAIRATRGALSCLEDGPRPSSSAPASRGRCRRRFGPGRSSSRRAWPTSRETRPRRSRSGWPAPWRSARSGVLRDRRGTPLLAGAEEGGRGAPGRRGDVAGDMESAAWGARGGEPRSPVHDPAGDLRLFEEELPGFPVLRRGGRFGGPVGRRVEAPLSSGGDPLAPGSDGVA